jgi:hypothetical protein
MSFDELSVTESEGSSERGEVNGEIRREGTLAADSSEVVESQVLSTRIRARAHASIGRTRCRTKKER